MTSEIFFFDNGRTVPSIMIEENQINRIVAERRLYKL